MHYTVKTQDVDGRSTKRFKSFAGARKRFEEMVGYTMEQVWDERVGSDTAPPTNLNPETLRHLRGVSMFGTVVIFERHDD